MTTATISRLNFTGMEEGGAGGNAPNQGHNGGNANAMQQNRRAAFNLTTQSGRTVQVWLTCSEANLLEPLARALTRLDLHLPESG